MESNKLIADFMEVNVISLDDVRKNKDPYHSSSDGYLKDDLKYHSSWDWLMQVVEKIESNDRYDVNILQYGTIIMGNQIELVNNVADISFDKKIDHTYDAVVKFIKKRSEAIINRLEFWDSGDGVDFEYWRDTETEFVYQVPIEIVRDFNEIKKVNVG